MQLVTELKTIEFDGITLQGYYVKPSAAPETIPAIILIPEIFGLNEHMEDLAHRFATAGYQVIVPDLYLNYDNPKALTRERMAQMDAFMESLPPKTWNNAELREHFINQEPGKKADELRETITALAPSSIYGPQPERTERLARHLLAWGNLLRSSGATSVGSIGYCMGGGLSFHLATIAPNLSLSVVYYGEPPQPEKMETITCTVLGFYGENDRRFTDHIPAVAQAMKERNKDYQYVIYEGQGHAFFNDTRSSYDVASSRDAWAKTLYYLNQHLK